MCCWLACSPSLKVPSFFCAAVGEASDDGEREEEDHVLRHLPRHRHHLRGVVALRPHRQNGGGNQTRSAQAREGKHMQVHLWFVERGSPC